MRKISCIKINTSSLSGLPILLIITALLIGITVCHPLLDSDAAQLIIEPGNSRLYLSDYNQTIKGWDDSGRTLFFIPSYVKISHVEQTGSDYRLLSEDGEIIQDIEPNQIEKVMVKTDTGEMIPWEIGFFFSKNLHTINVSLKDIDFPDIDHDRYVSGSVIVISPTGRVCFKQENILLKGRGNGSWRYTLDGGKRPYQIKFPERTSLCNLPPSDKWALIANAEDETKIRSKLVYDMAHDIDMEYAIDSDWVDLYINNEYLGNYLLCHEPSIGEFDLNIPDLDILSKPYRDSRQILTDDLKGYDYDISPVPKGGYLIEKQIDEFYQTKNSGFIYNGIPFSIKSPSEASISEVEYVHDFVDKVDSSIHNDSPQTALIDVYSFARRYLLEEISMNYDSAASSYYYYIKPSEDRLFAGPNWDQDWAFGKSSSFQNYTDDMSTVYMIRESLDPSLTVLDWDTCLRNNSDYEDYLASTFNNYCPIFEKYLSYRIDEYYDKLKYSLYADYIRWHGYEDNDNVIQDEYKYLKFFLYNRLTYLAGEYGCDITFKKPNLSDGSCHTLTFTYPDGTTYQMTAIDGEQIPSYNMLEYDVSKYDGWHWVENESLHSVFSYYTPVYSDMVFVLE